LSQIHIPLLKNNFLAKKLIPLIKNLRFIVKLLYDFEIRKERNTERVHTREEI